MVTLIFFSFDKAGIPVKMGCILLEKIYSLCYSFGFLLAIKYGKWYLYFREKYLKNPFCTAIIKYTIT